MEGSVYSLSKVIFNVLFNLIVTALFFWLIWKLCMEGIAWLKTRSKGQRIPRSGGILFYARIQDHPMIQDVVNAIQANPYPYPYGIRVEQECVHVSLWGGSKIFTFADYGNYGLQSASQLKTFATALIAKMPHSDFYRLKNDITREEGVPYRENKFVVFRHYDNGDYPYHYYDILNGVWIYPIKRIPTPEVDTPDPAPASKLHYL